MRLSVLRRLNSEEERKKRALRIRRRRAQKQRERYKRPEEKLRRKLQKKWRKIIFQRDNYKCRYCGNNSDLHLHHINPISKGKRIKMSYCYDNLITLCKECHNKIHTPRYHRIKTWLKKIQDPLRGVN